MSLYRYDLHVHTKESSGCGKLKARQVVELYKKAGYDGVVITDHWLHGVLSYFRSGNWSAVVDRLRRGYDRAAARGAQIGLDVFFGLELRFTGESNDYLVYGADLQFLRQHPDLFSLGLRHLHELARENGLLVYQAHPYRNGSEPADPALLDGVEVFNGNPRHDSRNEEARRFASDHSLLAISGSDCHRREDVGRGGILLHEKLERIEDLVRLLQAGKVAGLIGAEPSPV